MARREIAIDRSFLNAARAAHLLRGADDIARESGVVAELRAATVECERWQSLAESSAAALDAVLARCCEAIDAGPAQQVDLAVDVLRLAGATVAPTSTRRRIRWGRR